MQFVCLQEYFKTALSIVARAVASNGTLPVLNNVLVSACPSADRGPAQLQLSATDLSLSITTHIEAQIIADGAVTVPAALLLNFVGGLPAESVRAQLHARTQVLNLACARFSANIKGLDAGEFPTTTTAEPTLYVDAQPLRAACEQVTFAAALKEDARFVLTGVWFEFSASALRLVATDGNRLASKTVAMESDAASVRAVIVPARACDELARIISARHDGKVGIGLTRTNQIVFHVDQTCLTSNLVDGNYPAIGTLLERAARHDTRVRVQRRELFNAVRVADVMARQRGQVPVVTLDMTPGQPLVIGALGADGDHHSTVDAHIEGERQEVTAQTRYLLAAIDALSEHEHVALTTQAGSHPLVLRPDGNEQATHLIMPTGKPAAPSQPTP